MTKPPEASTQRATIMLWAPMEKMGVPRPAVAIKMAQELPGFDPSLLDTPDAPAPPGGAPEESDEDSD